MRKNITFDKEDEDFFGQVGSFGVPKFDNEMHGGVPRGFTMVAFTETGSGAELFASSFPRLRNPRIHFTFQPTKRNLKLFVYSKNTTGRSTSAFEPSVKSTMRTSLSENSLRADIVWRAFDSKTFNVLPKLASWMIRLRTT